MAEDDQRVDPRYDPAFQRGFEGTVTSGLRRNTAVRRTSLVSPAPVQATDGDVETAHEDPRIVDVEPTRSAADEEPEPTPELVTVSSLTMRQLSRNPFLIALVVLGGALTLGGLAWSNQARMLVSDRGGAGTDLDYWFLQTSVNAAPLATLAGIGILAGVMFVAAIAWNRRPPR